MPRDCAFREWSINIDPKLLKKPNVFVPIHQKMCFLHKKNTLFFKIYFIDKFIDKIKKPKKRLKSIDFRQDR